MGHNRHKTTPAGPVDETLDSPRPTRADLRSLDYKKFLNFNTVSWNQRDGTLCYKTSTAAAYEYTALKCGECILTPEPVIDFEALLRASTDSQLSSEDWLHQHILTPCFGEMAYSRLPYIFGKESSAQAAAEDRQGNCVAFAQFMLKSFETELHIDASKLAMIVPSTLPEAYHQSGYPHWGHAALAIPLKDEGCILLDPAIRLDKAVVLRESDKAYEIDWPEGPPSKGSRSKSKKWTFILDKNGGKVHAFYPDQPEVPSHTYFLKPILNADVAITIPTNDFNKRIPIVKTDRSGAKTAHLSIRMDKYRVEAFVNGMWKTPLKFSDLHADHAKLQQWLAPDQALQFTNLCVDEFYTDLIAITLASQVE